MTRLCFNPWRLAPSIDRTPFSAYFSRFVRHGLRPAPVIGSRRMKVKNSLKTAKLRHRECRVVRRHGRVYVINKRNPRFKVRQG